jgi:Domain of unknown function (DUF2014)/Helix-loop-helix DNA-binding domain
MLCSSAPDLDPPSFTESSADTSSSSSSGLFAPSATSLEFAKDMLPPPSSKAFEEESMSSFDWSKWEDWMQWDEDNKVAKSPVLQTASPSLSYMNPSLSPTSDNRAISNDQNSIIVQPSLGSFQILTESTNPFTLKEMPFEYGLDQPLMAFNNELQLPVDHTEPSTGAVLHSNSFPLEQFQFGGMPDACSSLPLEQPPAQNLVLDSFGLSGNSLSPASDSRRSVSISSPELNLSGQSRKRKTSTNDEDTDLAPTKPKRVLGAKEAHKVVEKKYRMNLNEKIAELRDSIPSFQQMRKGSQGNIDDDDENGNFDVESRQAGKPNKGLVLSKATEYIRHLERRNRKFNKEIAIMKIQLNAFKTLAMAGSMGLRNGAMQNPTSVQAMYANETRQPYQARPQVDVQVVSQAQNPSPRAQHVFRRDSGGGGGGYMSKLMVGSLAGLMILQGFSEKEQAEENPSGRGLFGLPTGYLSSTRHVWHSTHQFNAIGYMPLLARPLILFKAVLLIGAILYLISPSFFDAKLKEKPNPMSNLELTAAPSLASPVEVRRSAWLTAVQTVWVPRQSFLLQIAALVLKSMKLFLRNTIGWQRYAMLTGATEDQEAARVKAWEIALDAQLAGGDAEISISRLVLTMIASGTLLETPYRLMLKALHIHILLWEVAHGRLWGRYLYRSFAARFARYQWEKARKLQKQINSLPSSNETSGSDTLPDYLAHLLELDSDAIMVDAVVQRAYNLAWNKPTADKVAGYVDAMDSIIDDPTIHSPLDALAAWYSSLVLHEVLTISLETTTGSADQKVAIQDGLEVALKIAPTASLVQSRAISARAVLLDEGRGTNIAAALQALPMLSLHSVNNTLTTLETAPSSLIKSLTPDLALAIQCAMSIALLKRPKYSKVAIVFSQQIRFSHDTLGLLGFTAMYKFLAAVFQDKDVANEIRDVLENVAGALKMWMGRKQGENSELDKEAMVNVATLCVNVFNWLVGMSGDCSDGSELRDGK